MAKTPRQKLDQECLDLFSKVVRARDGACRNCNSTNRLQAHHIIQRTYKLSRYNPSNGIAFCSSCHFHEKVNHEKFRDMVISVIGEKQYLDLKKKYMVQHKWTLDELKTIRDELKSELNQYL